MNNADMPAMPITIAPSSDAIAQAQGAGMRLPRTIHHHGLTKREQMAIEFTKACIIGVHSEMAPGEAHGWSCHDFTNAGLEQADSLLAALNDKVAS